MGPHLVNPACGQSSRAEVGARSRCISITQALRVLIVLLLGPKFRCKISQQEVAGSGRIPDEHACRQLVKLVRFYIPKWADGRLVQPLAQPVGAKLTCLISMLLVGITRAAVASSADRVVNPVFGNKLAQQGWSLTLIGLALLLVDARSNYGLTRQHGSSSATRPQATSLAHICMSTAGMTCCPGIPRHSIVRLRLDGRILLISARVVKLAQWAGVIKIRQHQGSRALHSLIR